MNIKGSGDALNLRGSVYLTDSTIIGDGDTILGVGPAFFNHCEIQSIGPFMWIRNTEANHGNVFVNCTFIAMRAPAALDPRLQLPPRARSGSARPDSGPLCSRACPTTTASTTPTPRPCSSTAASRAFPPIGWGPIDDDTSHLHLWEFNSTDLDGHPIDITQRHPVSKQLTMPQDAQTIANYSNPAFVLGGWTPSLTGD